MARRRGLLHLLARFQRAAAARLGCTARRLTALRCRLAPRPPNLQVHVGPLVAFDMCPFLAAQPMQLYIK